MILKHDFLKIGILTSSRADFGIYKNLINIFHNDRRFKLQIIAFGMHLQPVHGNTINEIKIEGYKSITEIQGMVDGDSKLDISLSYSKLVYNFSIFWNKNIFDYVFCLGDRFEMSAAVQSGIPFEVNFIHLHGGEKSLGSTDNIYRNQISLASKIHFTANEEFSKRLVSLLDHDNDIITTGSLSLDGLDLDKIIDWNNICKSFGIPKNQDFILTTFHSETVGLINNKNYINEIRKALITLCEKINILITLPNADAMGSLYREMFFDIKNKKPNKIFIVSSLGSKNYFSAMKACNFVLGNSSSGIIEAASFSKFVINVGNRQLGRLKSDNTFDVAFKSDEILEACKNLIKIKIYLGENKYKKLNSTKKILNYLTAKHNL
jgi:GDP/UDP-N,N'-diacetylbacillosamine 2-epimerase (hydrolysing)